MSGNCTADGEAKVAGRVLGEQDQVEWQIEWQTVLARAGPGLAGASLCSCSTWSSGPTCH
jgi:hypothetical protein